jgi:transcriptional regulator with XRE-family HTH domain
MTKGKSIFSPDYSALIDLLTQERKNLSLSQSEVAQLLGMSQSDVSKIENQERRLDVLEFKQFLGIYRVQDNSEFRKHILTFLGLNDDTG